MAFQFPANPAPYSTVLNDITGSTYQWRPDLTKWVITTKKAVGGDLIWEGDSPPDPIGDYKLWYSTDTLELYFHYCDANGVCAWVPTSAPITMLEDLDNTVFELRRDLNQTNVAVRENENRIGRTIQYSDTAPTIFPEEEYDGEFFFNELNYKFWYDTARLELLVLIKDADGDYSYVPVSIPLTDIDLDALNTQVQANSYANNQQTQAIEALEQLIFVLKDELDALDNLSEDYFTSLVYHPFENVQTQYPLELIDKGPGWTGGGVAGQFFYDNADEPVHVGFRAEVSKLNEFDPGLAVRITHTSGVMYARIKGSWHSGQVHLNLESQKGDAFVEGEFVTEFAIQENKFVERTGDSMTGELLMQDANIKMNDGDIVFQPIVPDGDTDGERPERWNSLVSKRVRDANGNVIGGSNDFGIRVDLTEGRTGYNKFEFYSNVDGDSPSKFADFGGGNNPTFRFRRGSFQMEGNRIQKLGNAEADTDAISLGQVKDELKDLKDQIIQDAAVGVFKWDTQSSNTAPVAGCFFGKNGANNATEPFINNFRVSNQDINGANQDLSTWDVGDIITWTNSTNSAYQIRYRVQTVPTFQNGHYFFEVQYISQTNLFVQGNDFILTRQQFTNIDFGDLETTYLRLDGDNGPMQGNVNFGRNSITNMSAIDLVANGSYIKAAGNNMLRLYSGSLTSEGYAQVRVERPSKVTRGFAIRGYEEGSDAMRDLLYSYHPDSPMGDVIIYRGRTSSDQAIQTKESVKALIAEELANQAPNSGRVIITPLEFYMNSYGQYPNESSITGLTSGGNPTGGNDVYGYHIPWKWFEQNHPELIGYIYTPIGNLINGRAASVSERTVSGNPGLSIVDSSNRSNRATVTIQGWHVLVDDISEDQYTHKF